MFCRNCGHEQNDGKFCDVCGKPLGEVADVPSPAVKSKAAKKPKAPIIAVAAVCAVALGAGVHSRGIR